MASHGSRMRPKIPGEVGFRQRLMARRAARRDVRGDAHIGFEVLVDGLQVARTPYVDEIHDSAAAGSSEMMNLLWADNKQLLDRIHSRALSVLRNNPSGGLRDAVAQNRLNAVLALWAIETETARHAAEVVVHRHNQLIDVYWQELWSLHPEFRRAAGRSDRAGQRPWPVVLDQRWTEPLALIPVLPPRGSPATDDSVLDRALAIIYPRVPVAS